MTPRGRAAWIGIAVLGVAAVALADLPGLSPAGQYTVATMVFAAVLWVSGAIPLSLTALTIPVLLALFGVYDDFGEAVAGFADPVIFLLLAGFMLAAALQYHDIDRRVALRILVRLGTSPSRIVLGIMLATAGLSMVISNTATTAMMVPIVVGLVGEVTTVETEPGAASNFQIAALLGIAYAASLGGVGTLIGTPPNAIVVGQLRELLGYHVTFANWLLVGLPMVAVTLPVAWYLLTGVIYPPQIEDVSDVRRRARADLAAMPELDRPAKYTLAVFAATALLWLAGGLGFLVRPHLPRVWYTTLFGGPGRTVFGTVGHQGALYYVLVGLLAIPALNLLGDVEWEALTDIDWSTLVLLGGGITLANALADTQATRWLAERIFAAVGTPSLLVLVGVIVAMTVLVGELASNTAMAAILAPLLINVGPAYAAVLGTGAETAGAFLAIAGAVAASYGFALPVATPPNAIVFGEGYLSRGQMLRAGVPLDVVVILLAAVVLSASILFVWPTVLP
ncbi:MAG: SLC13 family permease [Halanaeroarchaeum sp.]